MVYAVVKKCISRLFDEYECDFKWDENIVDFLSAWWCARTSEPSVEELTDLFTYFLNTLDKEQLYVSLEDVLDSHVFDMDNYDTCGDYPDSESFQLNLVLFN